MSKFELMEDKQTSELSDSLKAAEIRFRRVRRIVEELFSRVKEVKGNDRRELTEKFLMLVNSPTNLSNKILLVMTANELMQPVPRIELHPGLRSRLLALLLNLRTTRFASKNNKAPHS